MLAVFRVTCTSNTVIVFTFYYLKLNLKTVEGENIALLQQDRGMFYSFFDIKLNHFHSRLLSER